MNYLQIQPDIVKYLSEYYEKTPRNLERAKSAMNIKKYEQMKKDMKVILRKSLQEQFYDNGYDLYDILNIK